MEQFCDQMKGKLERKKAKEKYLKETLDFREQELEKKEVVLRKMSQSAEEAQKKLKTTTLKLRQVEQTKLKDLQRALADKEKTLQEL